MFSSEASETTAYVLQSLRLTPRAPMTKESGAAFSLARLGNLLSLGTERASSLGELAQNTFGRLSEVGFAILEVAVGGRFTASPFQPSA